MRLSPQTGKTDCHIIDFVDSTSRGSSIVSTPTLFGLDPDDVIQGKTNSPIYRNHPMMRNPSDETIDSLEARAASQMGGGGGDLNYDDGPLVEPESVTYTDYENPFALVEDSSGAPHIAQLSKFAWVGCGEDIYILECLGKGHLKIDSVTEENGM